MKTFFEEKYYFIRKDYNKDGFNINTGVFFLDYIGDCENDFYHKYHFKCANCLFANVSTMYLIKCCLYTDEDDDFGMDLIEGKINLDANLEIEKHSKRKTTYAIGSKVKGNEEEPLFLIIDESLADGEFVLKYIDEDSGKDDKIGISPAPVNEKTIELENR